MRRYGIDTSVLVRLVSGDPPDLFQQCVDRLTEIVAVDEVWASNQVVGEAYVALQHHYGVTKDEAKSGLLQALRSGLVRPFHGPLVLEALATTGGCGLLDRLIVIGYRKDDLQTLTLDGRMAKLEGAAQLVGRAG